MMEAAEHAFLRSLGLSVLPPATDPERVTWPRVSAQCDYLNPVRFEDLLQISVKVARIGQSSVTYQFDFACGERAIATGSMTAVCCLLADGGLKRTEIPGTIRELLSEHQ